MANSQPSVRLVDSNILQPHPKNSLIYGGNEDVSNLVELIGRSGWVKPLVVTPTYQIISGHRRWRAARKLELSRLPVEVKEFSDETAELEALLLENASRLKTTEQKVREANAWKEIEAQKAKLRKLATQNNDAGRAEAANLPGLLREKGETRNIIAQRVGLKARSYEKAAKVVEVIDELETIGSVSHATALRFVLNSQSVDAAYQLIRKPASSRSQILEAIAGGKTLSQALSLHQPTAQSTRDSANTSKATQSREEENNELQGESQNSTYRSCWNCQNRGESIDSQSFYCFMRGQINCITSEVKAIASECEDWRERTMHPDKADYSNPRFKTYTYQVTIPFELKQILEEKATKTGVSPEEWIKILLSTHLLPPSNDAEDGNGKNYDNGISGNGGSAGSNASRNSYRL